AFSSASRSKWRSWGIFNFGGFQRVLPHHGIANPPYFHFRPHHDTIHNFLTKLMFHKVHFIRKLQAFIF
ncbi:hypothetical protein ACVGWR_20415, partial [Enterobacter hormaechei]